jgi:transposase
MSRPPIFPAEDKIRIVLSALSGEVTIAEAARRNKVSEQSIGRWKAQFLEGGRAGVVEGGKTGPSGREEQLQAQIDELMTALGEAHVELRVWKRSAEHRLGPSKISR